MMQEHWESQKSPQDKFKVERDFAYQKLWGHPPKPKTEQSMKICKRLDDSMDSISVRRTLG